MPNQVNVAAVVDNSRIGAFQLSVFALCFCCLAIDGFDVQALGYVAPALMAELGITRAELGPVLSAAPFGVTHLAVTRSLLSRYGQSLAALEARSHFRRVYFTGDPAGNFVAVLELKPALDRGRDPRPVVAER